MTSFNLIPGHRREARRRQRRTRVWAIACAGYATVLLGGYVLCRATWSGPDSALAGDLVEAAAQTQQQIKTTAQVGCDDRFGGFLQDRQAAGGVFGPLWQLEQ